jgi:hypothetical protein
MDVSLIDMSEPRARQLRDEPQSGRYPTRGYQQRQPSLERGAADQMDLQKEPGKSGLRMELMTMRRDRCAYLTEDSHINVRLVRSAPGVTDPSPLLPIVNDDVVDGLSSCVRACRCNRQGLAIL